MSATPADTDRRPRPSAPAPGPAAVLLHGSADSPQAWTGVVRALPEAWAVTCPALPALPDSAPWGTVLGLDWDLPWLDRVMTQSQARILAGHSYGALLALRWALLHPGRLDGLLLAEPISWGMIRQQPAAGRKFAELQTECVDRLVHGEAERALQWLVDYWNGPGFWEGLPPRVRAGLLAGGQRTCAEVQSGNADQTHAAEVSALLVPVALLAGAQTTAESLAVSVALRDALPNAQLVVVPEAGHQFLRSHAALVAGALSALAS